MRVSLLGTLRPPATAWTVTVPWGNSAFNRGQVDRGRVRGSHRDIDQHVAAARLNFTQKRKAGMPQGIENGAGGRLW